MMAAAAPALTGAPLIDRLADSLGATERRETHASWVLLTADRAFKVKKPVVMDFLDYGSVERRREMCRREVAVNRRGAPDLYLGSRAIVPAGHGLAVAPEAAPGAIEYAVEMRRFEESATLAARVENGEVTLETVAAVGRHLAAYHARCPRVRRPGGGEAIKRSLDDDFATLSCLLGADDGARRRIAGQERFAGAFLASRWTALDARARDGRVRDAHGDLRLEHVVLENGVLLVDAIEFHDRLRQIDVGLDVAFLVMDLQAAGREDLVGALVGAYRSAGGDPGDDALIAFFAAYRARVRAKVALLRARQLPARSAGAVGAREQADQLLALAESLTWRARTPLIVAVGGVSGSGKTTLAAALADVSGLPYLSSDVVRKGLVGLQPHERAPQSAYAEPATQRTYRELGRRAAGSAIVDATFHRLQQRDWFRSGLGASDAPVVFVECRAPGAVLERRIAARAGDPARTSDATIAVLGDQLRQADPLDEVAARDHLMVRTDRPLEDVIDAVAAALDARLLARR